MRFNFWARIAVGAGVTVASVSAMDMRLTDAIKRRDHRAVAALVAQKADINAAQPDGATPLAWAVYLDDRESADLLLSAGANVKTADEYGEAPLTLPGANGTADEGA